MRILVFNSGSSSLKFELFEGTAGDALTSLARGAISAFGARAHCVWTISGADRQVQADIHTHRDAALWVLDTLQSTMNGAVSAVGHRIVHGGDAFSAPLRITDDALAALAQLTRLAPLHNPPGIEVIEAARLRLGVGAPMVAVFDTAFFRNLPDYVSRYALPAEWTRAFGIKRYGFHGIAHRYLSERYAELHPAARDTARVITLQLGQGCSIAALRGATPLETSMGFTPLEGLIMATRPGDVDAGALLHVLEAGGLNHAQLQEGLNRRAGLLGLSDVSADMRELLRMEEQGHDGARLAVQAFCHRARKYLGAYLAALGGADAVIFGGGIGEHAWQIRERICAGMEWCGLILDKAANAAAHSAEQRISAEGSAMEIYVLPVNEELVIARDTLNLLVNGG
ncbi:MAG: acetate/propionate family kinase [Pseudomonadota bacterium]